MECRILSVNLAGCLAGCGGGKTNTEFSIGAGIGPEIIPASTFFGSCCIGKSGEMGESERRSPNPLLPWRRLRCHLQAKKHNPRQTSKPTILATIAPASTPLDIPPVVLPEFEDPTEVLDGDGLDAVVFPGTTRLMIPEYTVTESRSMNGALGVGESGERLKLCLPGPRPLR